VQSQCRCVVRNPYGRPRMPKRSSSFLLIPEKAAFAKTRAGGHDTTVAAHRRGTFLDDIDVLGVELTDAVGVRFQVIQQTYLRD
jgi:hypothetical protein